MTEAKVDVLAFGRGLMKGLAHSVDPRTKRFGTSVFRWFSDLPSEDQRKDPRIDARRCSHETGEASFPVFYIKSVLDDGDIFDPQVAPGPFENPEGFKAALQQAMYHAAAVRGIITLADSVCLGWVVVADPDIYGGRHVAVSLMTASHYRGADPLVCPITERPDYTAGDPMWAAAVELEALLGSIEWPDEYTAVGSPKWNLEQYELFTSKFALDPTNMGQWDELQNYVI
jgi:hypothetical protein